MGSYKTLAHSKNYLQQKLNYVWNGEKCFISKHTKFEKVVTMAGKDTGALIQSNPHTQEQEGKGGNTVNITDEQRKLLEKYSVEVLDDVDDTLLALDDKITEVGFNTDYSLNKKGRELQKLYDELYAAN